MKQFTVKEIETLLRQEAYKPVPRINKNDLTDAQKAEVRVLEDITSFGQDLITLFDHQINELGTLPTQKQFTDAGVAIMIDWIKANKPQIAITEIIKEASKLRMTRTYMSKVVELHLEALFREEFPEFKVFSMSLLDSVMGVDFVVEDDVKRYYVHITSNSPFAHRMLVQKENRGGYMAGRTYVPYSRDFSNDLILKYDTYTDSETTKIINGFPLFKADFIAERFFIAKRQGKIGEDLNTEYSKLQHFKDWAKTYLKMNITTF